VREVFGSRRGRCVRSMGGVRTAVAKFVICHLSEATRDAAMNTQYTDTLPTWVGRAVRRAAWLHLSVAEPASLMWLSRNKPHQTFT
jgi:hypothetical protein